MSPEEIQAQVDTFQRWYHRIKLAPGVLTPGTNNATDSLAKLEELGLPEDCTGLRVLDIGCRDGYFSFEMERRGAEIVAIDYEPAEATGFPIASRILDSAVEFRHLDFYELDPERHGLFDLVLFLGVIYHLRYPILAIERVFQLLKPGGRMFLETQLTVDEEIPWAKAPSWEFVPGNAFQGDDTNKWLPSPAGLEGAVADCGLEDVAVTTGGNRGFAYGRRPEVDVDGTAAVLKLRSLEGDPDLGEDGDENEEAGEGDGENSGDGIGSFSAPQLRSKLRNLVRIVEARNVLVDSLYSQLDIARREVGNRDRELESRAQLLAARDQEVGAAKESLVDLRKTLAKRQQEADAGAQQATSLEAVVQQRDAETAAGRDQIAALEDVLKARSTEIAAAKEQLDNLRRVFGAREAELVAAADQIGDLHQVLAAKEAHLATTSAALDASRGTLEALGGTFFGKVALKLLHRHGSAREDPS